MAKIKEQKKTKKSSKPNTSLSAKPTIGIIGGCGVLATVDIEKEIIQAAQRLMFPIVDQDYPNMLVYQYTQFHDRNDAICFNGRSPYKQYLKCANALVSIGVQVLLFACNTAHIHIGALKKKIKTPIIDMIQEAVKDTMTRFPGVSKIGLLSTDATIKAKLYQKAFAPYKVSIITPSAFIRKQVMRAIYLIKAGITNEGYQNGSHLKKTEKTLLINNHPHKKILLQKDIPKPCELINNAVLHLSNKGCAHIILGCTELPLVIKNMKANNNKITLINPNKIIAEAVIEFCMVDQKSEK
jgi:aspartate racemase